MKIIDVLQKRRTYYNLNKTLPVSKSEVKRVVEEITELVPDAFNMKSARVIVVTDNKQDELWDKIYDTEVVETLQKQFPLYADNFPVWANQANGMLQINIWTGLRELGIGANLQHYNPVIDKLVQEMFEIPKSWKLIAQMPFGGIVTEPEPKAKENIEERVKFI